MYNLRKLLFSNQELEDKNNKHITRNILDRLPKKLKQE